MSESLILPVLPLDDAVVLPGMVVPLDVSDTEVRAAIDARPVRRGTSRMCCSCRDRRAYGAGGRDGLVEQVGRLPGASPRPWSAGSTGSVGAGTTGPGAALWVEAHRIDGPVPPSAPSELATEYKALATTIMQKRGGWQVVDAVNQIDDPRCWPTAPATPPWLSAAAEGRAAPDSRPGRAPGPGWSSWPASTWPSSTSPRPSARTSRRAWTSSSGSSCSASSWPRSARSSPS